MLSAMHKDEALYLVMFSGGSVAKRQRRLRNIRHRYEARLTGLEASLIEVRATLELIDRVLADFAADSCMLSGKQGEW